MHNIRRTAVYAIRTYGGVGGGSCKASPYPDRTALIQLTADFLTVAFAATLPMTEKPTPPKDAQS